jgi:hypothetical protein
MPRKYVQSFKEYNAAGEDQIDFLNNSLIESRKISTSMISNTRNNIIGN